MNAFSKNLKFLRQRRALKQTEMFNQLGFKQTTWNNYERGIAYPNILDLLKICDFFAVSADDLLRKDMTPDISEVHDDGAHYEKKINALSKDFGEIPSIEPDNQLLAENERCKTEIEYLKQLLDQKEQTIQAQTLTIRALQSLVAKETGA